MTVAAADQESTISATEQSDLLATCERLAESFAKRAAKYDREGSFPVENFEELKEAGLLGIMVPKEFGGLGATFEEYTKALETLAMGDATTGLTFNMHNITVGTIAELDLKGIGGSLGAPLIAFRDWVYEEAVQNKKLFASASSEPGIGAHFSKMKTSYRAVDGGFVINGSKSFVSMAGYADYYVVAARREDDTSDGVPALSFLCVEYGNPGAEFEDIWDVLGMRGTATNPMHMKDCFVPQDRLFLGSEGMALFKIAREPHWVVGGYNGVYLGICSAAFNFMVEFLKKKKMPGTDTSVSENPVVIRQVGDLYAALRATRETTYRAARLVDQKRGSVEANEAIHHAKYSVCELGPRLTSEAIRLCGAGSLAKRFPLERHYRDARCGGLMPATSDECLEYLGKSAFGVQLTDPEETYW